MKVSLYMDEDLWRRFKKKVVQRTGDTRGLSREVENLIRDSMTVGALERGFDQLGVGPKRLAPPPFKPVVPAIPTSSSRTLREMRKTRLAKGIS